MKRTVMFIATVAMFAFASSCSGSSENGGDNGDGGAGGGTNFDNQVKTFTVNGVSFKMMPVAGGTFQMGATPEQSNGYNPESHEYPVHSVTLSNYYIGQTEVTQELWYAVMGAKPSSNYSWGSYGLGNKYPAYWISYADCLEFIAKLNQLTGQQFRLPTEAEWEYAARGGRNSRGYVFSGSNYLSEVAWFFDNSTHKSHPVAQLKPNELGIYDMSGNVEEWCSDWYGSYSNSAQTNPTGPTTSSTYRICRGGCYYGCGETDCRVAARGTCYPANHTSLLGLRIALSGSGNPGNNQNNGNGNTGTGFDSQVKAFAAKGVSFKMVPVAGGTFQMGATQEQKGENYQDDELPVHSVTLGDYYIGQTEVTQALWFAVMGSKPTESYKWTAKYGLGDNIPAYGVSYDDCIEFIKALNELTGQYFRLPTEAEWEYAARGGQKSKGYKYSGGNIIGNVAWYGGNSGSICQPVATRQANELGIYDMSGNVEEWCSDWYRNTYIDAAQTNPTGPYSGDYRVNRGGTWDMGSTYCRVSRRNGTEPHLHYNNFGLRLALSSVTTTH